MKQNSDKAYEKKYLMKEMRNLAPEERAGYGKSVNELKEWAIDRFSKMEEKMKQLEKEITETDRKKSMERLKNYEKAIADILADVKKNKNKESVEE